MDDMKKENILVLGGTGMLGSAVGIYLNSKKNFNVMFTDNASMYLEILAGLYMPLYGKIEQWRYFDVQLHSASHLDIANFDYVINCIGVTNNTQDKALLSQINAVFPHELAEECKTYDIKLIHMSTDMVFDGFGEGCYVEKDKLIGTCPYSCSKILGEPDDAMTLRTSIVGYELLTNNSFLSWCMLNKGKEVTGFSTWFWNGITTLQFAKYIEKIINNNMYEEGKFHMYSTHIHKSDLVCLVSDIFRLNMIVDEKKTTLNNRTLFSSKKLIYELGIVPIKKQIKELKLFVKKYKLRQLKESLQNE